MVMIMILSGCSNGKQYPGSMEPVTDDLAFQGGQVLIRMKESDEAVRALTRVVARFVLTDVNGKEHTVAEKLTRADEYPAYVSAVGTYRSDRLAQDCYSIYVDVYMNDSLRKTLLRILYEEIEDARLKVDLVTGPNLQDDNVTIVEVGPGADEIFGDVPYEGWRPMDIVERKELPKR